ncbi:sporulation sigma factor SigK [Carboxydothermus islandicus]|uniref:RNA polymerase sigma factor n=1 Tax=Carboxydothermus islandicus TaxID=661089 RepID=A0A1L8CZL9_9THEO|nr:RNA polymerase sporulation sigma factor SigK [Carboxydothermus islandicus]GAV24386.1 sporulation sigma factor SigK [Carboxydothermus islandicus]
MGVLGALITLVVEGLLFLLGYLAGSAFPQPLSEEEEAYYIDRLLQGDREARDVLAERNLRLVAHIVKKFEGTGEATEDLISIGTIGLIKAIDTFRPDKGTKLATYAAKCVENEILMHLRATKKNRGEVSLYDPIGFDKEGNEITLLDILGTRGDIVLEQVVRMLDAETIEKNLKKLTPRERKVIEERFGLSQTPRKTQREIARKMGISRSYVSRIEKKAILKLLNCFPENNLKH